MIEDVQTLLDRYSRWLRDRTHLRELEECVEITTPYLDRHNDYLQIYAKRVNGGFLLTDDGYVLDDLELCGCKINSPKRKAIFETTLAGFGVRPNGTALEAKASAEDFALRKHNLVQAMLAVNDLFYLASTSVASLFHEDVIAWLDLSEIRYTPKRQVHREKRLRSSFRCCDSEIENPTGALSSRHQSSEPRSGTGHGILLAGHEGNALRRHPSLRRAERLGTNNSRKRPGRDAQV